MRYYSIVITKADGTPYLFKSLGGLALTSLLPTGPQNPLTGITNPAALNIEFDIPIVVLSDPDNNAWLRIWGLGLQDIGNASDLNGLDVAIYAGMAKGLPLANPAQAGLIMQGKILYAFGNWVGTDQTIDMNFIPAGATGSPAEPANFPFAWKAGTPLATAVAQTLSIAMPGVAQQLNISPSLVLNYDVTGWYQSATQFADFINELSRGVPIPGGGTLSVIGGGAYQGVSIATNGNSVNVSDGTQPSQAKAVAFTDLIGQPTWIGPGQISIKTVLRADLHAFDTITIPPGLVTVTSQGAIGLALADKSSFSGSYTISQIHHYGNFRQPSADAWNTTIQAFPVAASVPAAPPSISPPATQVITT